MKILVVDDDPVIGTLVNEFLTAHGHEIEVLNSGEECLARLSEAARPDMLLLDLVMPDMTGIDVLQRIKGNKETNSIPVVMLSAKEDTSELLDKYAFQADRYVEKPFNIRKLLDVIRDFEPS